MSFFAEIKHLAKDASIYGISSVIGRGVSLFMAPVMTRIFLPQDYGIISLIQLSIGFFVMIAGMNIASGMSYYYYHHDKIEDRRATLSTGFVVITVFAFITALGLYMFSEKVAELLQWNNHGAPLNYDLAKYLRIAAIGLFFSLSASGVQSVIFLLRQPQKFLRMQIVEIVLQVGGVLALVVWLRAGIPGVFWANAMASGIAFVVGLYFIRGALGKKLSLSFLGLMLAYSLPQLPGVMINWTQTQIGRIFINYYSNLTDLGLYSIAFTLASVLVLAITAFRMAYDPYSLSIMKRDDAKIIYSRVYDLYAVSFGCLFGWIGAFAKTILIILTPPTYHDAYSMVIFILAAGFYMGANNILATGIWISKKTSHTSYALMIAFCVLVVTSFLLIPIYGGLGAAISYLCGTIAQSFAYYVFAQKLWPIPYRYWKVHGFVLSVVMINVVNNQLIVNWGLIGSVISATVVSSLIAVLGWLYVLTGDERRKIIMFLKKQILSLRPPVAR